MFQTPINFNLQETPCTACLRGLSISRQPEDERGSSWKGQWPVARACWSRHKPGAGPPRPRGSCGLPEPAASTPPPCARSCSVPSLQGQTCWCQLGWEGEDGAAPATPSRDSCTKLLWGPYIPCTKLLWGPYIPCCLGTMPPSALAGRGWLSDPACPSLASSLRECSSVLSFWGVSPSPLWVEPSSAPGCSPNFPFDITSGPCTGLKCPSSSHTCEWGLI